jgi:hypothetical protein
LIFDHTAVTEILRLAGTAGLFEFFCFSYKQKTASNPDSRVFRTTFDHSSTSVGLAKQPYEQKYHLPNRFGLFGDFSACARRFAQQWIKWASQYTRGW